MTTPFIRPNPPKLSTLSDELREIEASCIFSNNGPVNQKFEARVIDEIFGGSGSCMTVSNATIGLMIAIKDALLTRKNKKSKYALMPSFTFAATPHAALWCGLTPLLYDIDINTWLPSEGQELELLEEYGSEIGVLVPYATFGNNLDINRYELLSRHYDVPVVIDAAASLGSANIQSNGFGVGSTGAVVFSMHVTKMFATSEAGLIFSEDRELIKRLRAMANFGFQTPRVSHMPGLNAKLPEIGALLALRKLDELNAVVERRAELFDEYKSQLSEFTFQEHMAGRVAHQFVPVLLPRHLSVFRDEIINEMTVRGFGIAKYFSPHIAEHPYFLENCKIQSLSNTKKIAERTISLPLNDFMTKDDVREVCSTLNNIIDVINSKSIA